jgi:hypothetical protein
MSAPPKPSAVLRARVLEHLRELNCHLWGQQQTSFGRRARVVRSGVPDVIGFSPRGQFMGIEIKAGEDTLHEDQWVFLERLWRSGGLAFVVRSELQVLALAGRLAAAHWHGAELTDLWTAHRSDEWGRMRKAAREALQKRGLGL